MCCHAGTLMSNLFFCKKKKKKRVPFQHKTPNVQLSAFTDFLCCIQPPTHFSSEHQSHSLTSPAISNGFHSGSTFIFDWRQTPFFCIKVKCSSSFWSSPKLVLMVFFCDRGDGSFCLLALMNTAGWSTESYATHTMWFGHQ